MSSTKTLLAFGLVAVGVLTCAVLVDPPKNERSASSAQAQPVAKAVPRQRTGADTLVDIVQQARSQYDGARNDMAKGAARPARKQAICSFLQSFTITDWVGTIQELSTNGDGKGILAISLGSDVSVKTWNNALSDIGDRTLIDPNSTLFQTLTSMKVGQTVHFSGNFFRSDSDCIRETSMTMHGSITEPEFLFRFTSVTD
jgi:hypothetical protein